MPKKLLDLIKTETIKCGREASVRGYSNSQDVIVEVYEDQLRCQCSYRSKMSYCKVLPEKKRCHYSTRRKALNTHQRIELY